MFDFWKQPKFWVVTVLILWLAYVIGSNLEGVIVIHIVPWLLQPYLKVSTIVIASGIVGGTVDTRYSIPLAQRPRFKERFGIDARTRHQQQHGRLIARLQHARCGRTDQQRLGARK